MKHTREERLDIGRRIYDGEITWYEAADMEDLESMTKEELIRELVIARITEARLKRLRGERGWFGNTVRQQEYQVIMELSGEYPVKLLCETMGIQRSSIYNWKKHLSNPFA